MTKGSERNGWRAGRRWWSSAAALALAIALAGCGNGEPAATTPAAATPPASTNIAPTTDPSVSAAPESSPAASATTAADDAPSGVPPLPEGWVETEVRIPTSQGELAGTLTHPADTEARMPAALIVGGSGPTDRNGNSGVQLPTVNTLLTVSRWLADDGVATLRYDKLGSGKTGLGDMTAETMASSTFEDYVATNAQALTFLAAQPGVDPERLDVVGHSEGGLVALLLGAGDGGSAEAVPPVRAIASLEGLSLRFLDILRVQLAAQLAQASASGQIPAAEAGKALISFDAAVTALRAGDPPPTDLSPLIAGVFAPSTLTYLRTADAVDPAEVAARLPASMPVLLSCSDADIQVSCDQVEKVDAAAQQADAAVVLVRLKGVAHSLKVDDSRSPQNYNADLPFSAVLRDAVSTWSDA